MTIIEWRSGSGDLTNNRSIILPIYSCIIIICHGMQLTFSIQLHVPLFFVCLRLKLISDIQIFLYEIQQKSCHIVICVRDSLHTLQNENIEELNLAIWLKLGNSVLPNFYFLILIIKGIIEERFPCI